MATETTVVAMEKKSRVPIVAPLFGGDGKLMLGKAFAGTGPPIGAAAKTPFSAVPSTIPET